MAGSIQDLQKQLFEENLDKYNTEAEKVVKRTMAQVSGASENMSATAQAYFQSLTQTVQASDSASQKQLGYTVERISKIKDAIQTASDLSSHDKEILNDQISIISENFKNAQSNNSGLIDYAKKALSDNAVDITSIVAGLTSNNPAIMFATKWIGDTIKERKEERLAAQRAIDEASANIDIPEPSDNPQVAEQEVTNEKLDTLIGQQEAWQEADEQSAWRDEEARRESERYNAEVLSALEDIGGGEGPNLDDIEIKSDGGGLLDKIISGVTGGISGGIAGGGIAGAISSALGAAAPWAPLVAGVAMGIKDGWDIASAVFDDDIATGIEGADIGGVAGSTIGGTIGFLLGGPIGAGIGAVIGNWIGETIGEFFDPDREALLADSRNEIMDRQQALQNSYAEMEQLYKDGLISQEQWLAAKKDLDEQIAEANRLDQMAAEVGRLKSAKDAAAAEYNRLNAQIERMEELGLEVPQAMYDQLELAEQKFEEAEAAFERGADELDAAVDPSWWSELGTSIADAVKSVNDKVEGAFTSVRNSITSLAIPDIEELSPEKRAEIQAKVDALPADLENISGLTLEQLVLLSEDLEMSPEDLAAMDSAAVLRATAMDSIGDGIENIGNTVSEKVQAIGDALWAGAEALGIDDEIQDASTFVQEKIDSITQAAGDYWNKAKGHFADMQDKIAGWYNDAKSWLGFGDDEETPEENTSALTVQTGDTEQVRVQDLTDEELRDETSSRREEARDARRMADMTRRAMAQGNFNYTIDGREATEEEKLSYLADRESTAVALEEYAQEARAETDRRIEVREAEALAKYQENQIRIAELEAAIQENSWSSVGMSSSDERRSLAELQAQNREYEDAQFAQEQERYRSQMDLYTSGFADVEPVAPDRGAIVAGLSAENAQMRDAEAAQGTGGNASMISAPTINNNSTIQRVQPRVPVRNSSDDYRSFDFGPMP